MQIEECGGVKMYEVELLNLKANERFTKKFWAKETLMKFLKKVEHSKKLKLLCITDNSYLYD